MPATVQLHLWTCDGICGHVMALVGVIKLTKLDWLVQCAV